MNAGLNEDREWLMGEMNQLRVLWADPKMSTAAIGAAMRRSKNSIVAKAHRLGLPGRASPIITIGPAAPKQNHRRGAFPPGHPATWALISPNRPFPDEGASQPCHPISRTPRAIPLSLPETSRRTGRSINPIRSSTPQ